MNAADSPPRTLAALRERSRWLAAFAHDVYSQTGEDGVIAKALEVIGVASGICVDVGAWDGLHGSNTRNLVLAGWRSVQIECCAERFTALERLYAGHPRVCCVSRRVDHRGPSRLDAILDGCEVPAVFDLLSVDIDGNDWHVWQSLRRRPHLVLIEYNFTVPDEISFVQPPDPSIAQGASLRALVELGKTKGYELIHASGLNALFVTRELFTRFNITDNCLEVMHVPRFDERTAVFFGYDGTVFVRGSARAPWHKLPFPEDRVQLLPRGLRKSGGYTRWQTYRLLAIRARLEGRSFQPRKWLTALRLLFGRRTVTNVPGT